MLPLTAPKGLELGLARADAVETEFLGFVASLTAATAELFAAFATETAAATVFSISQVASVPLASPTFCETVQFCPFGRNNTREHSQQNHFT